MKKKWQITGIIILIVIASPFIAKFGYCQGWWLKRNPWAYHWWLCDCGPKLERRLYPDNIEIVVSACEAPQEVALSPNGQYMIVSLGENRPRSYRLDLVTGQRQLWPYLFWSTGATEFWTDRLVWVQEPDRKKGRLVDVTDGSIVNLTIFKTIRQAMQSRGLIIPTEALQAFRDADRVLLQTNSSIPFALALTFDLKQNPKRSYLLYYPQDYSGQLLDFFLENGIDYEQLGICWRKMSCISHDGRFVATNQHVVTSSDRQLLTKLQGNPSFSWGSMMIGWAHDDSGVYLQFNPDSYIIDGGGFVMPNLFRLPQPIVKLKVPEEYLQATPSP